ncbi:ATP-dependent DNA ligase [Candidatus Roizmanbacteria bacterium]|nr:ATP-dependent DNA ligase [Candidatus Roizmanbacteria bacterium]
MKFKELAKFFEQIENTTSRLSITYILAELFKKLDKNEIEKTVYLLQGRLAPLYEALEFGMAEKMIIKGIVSALGMEQKIFVREYKKIGDMGKTVEHFKKQKISFEQKNLSILEVYEKLYKIATAGGQGSQEVKIRTLAELVSQADSLSSRYLVRIPSGVLRLGFSDMTVLDAFSWMLKGDKSLRPLIEKAYHVRPDLGNIGYILKEKGVEWLKRITPKIFTPIIMMRAERLSSAKEIIKKIGRSAVEPKYDGFRLQVHYKNHSQQHEVRLYSRNLEEVSFMYPDVIEGVKKEVKAREIIFEGEAIGFDPHSGTFLPFQETVQRKRKYGIEEKIKEIPLKLFAFELLYIDGKSYLGINYLERRRMLEKHIKLTGDIFKDAILIAPENLVDEEKKLELLFDDAISKGLEGVIAKKLDGIYQPGARGWNWIKFKRSYNSKIEDTIDCLVMGYDYGKGKRTNFGIGAFLVGIYDEKKDNLLTVAKIGTGLSDQEWKELKKRCERFRADKKPALYDVDKLMNVDVWVKPMFVVEIKADEITRSPVHTAGRKMKSSKSGQAFEVDIPGFALRFPRLERFRDDKRPEEITTLRELRKMFKSQGKK